MGEIADMTVDGTLCTGCGVFISPGEGYPRYCRGCQPGGGPVFVERGMFGSRKMAASFNAAGSLAQKHGMALRKAGDNAYHLRHLERGCSATVQLYRKKPPRIVGQHNQPRVEVSTGFTLVDLVNSAIEAWS